MSSAPPDGYRPAADLLAGRVILVTGAGDGLGKAAALALAEHGATVVLLGRKVRPLERVYDAIEQAGGPQPAIYPLNLEGAAPQDPPHVPGAESARLRLLARTQADEQRLAEHTGAAAGVDPGPKAIPNRTLRNGGL